MDETQAVKVAVEKGPFVASNLLPTVWMVAVSILGGFASFYRKYQNKEVKFVNFMELVGELMVSVLVGLITYWICKSFAVEEYLTVAAVAITSHMGTRAIAIFEKALIRKTEQVIGPVDK